MSRNPGTYLDPLYCEAIKIYCRDTGTTQQEMADEIGIGRVRLSEILNQRCPASRPRIEEVEQVARSLMTQHPGVMEQAHRRVSKPEEAEVSELMRKLNRLSDDRKLACLRHAFSTSEQV